MTKKFLKKILNLIIGIIFKGSLSYKKNIFKILKIFLAN